MGMTRASNNCISLAGQGPIDSIAARRPLAALDVAGRPDENVDLRPRLFKQALHEERPDEASATGQQDMIRDNYLAQRRRCRRVEDEIPIIAHHLLFRCPLPITEGCQGMTQLNERFLRRTFQLFRESKEISHADPAE